MSLPGSSPEEEWARANKGAWKRRLPVVVGLCAGLLFGGCGAGVSAAIGGAAEARQEELAAKGLREICVGRGCSRERDNIGSGLLLIAIPGVLALVGFAVGFFVAGGKVASEYVRGAARM